MKTLFYMYNMGLSESNLATMLKSFECLSHCKITARSPCCRACCNEGRECSMDTHNCGSEDSVISNDYLRSFFLLDSYVCQCPPGYQGTFCEIFVDWWPTLEGSFVASLQFFCQLAFVCRIFECCCSS